jgi:O-antigen/teichoic acid export membrane protein
VTERSAAASGPRFSAGELLDRPRAAASSGPSLRRNVAWSLAGNVIYAGGQWAMLVILAKLTSPLAVGQFALGLALTAPVVLLMNLRLRAALATDARGAYEFCDYLALRLTTVVLMLGTVTTTALLAGYRRETMLVVIGIALAKCAESTSDIFHGLFQRHERMELIAKSSIAKSALSLAAFSTGVFLTRDPVWAVAGLAAAWTAVLVGYDIPQAVRLARHDPSHPIRLRPRWRGQSLLKLVRVTLPLGIAAMLVGLNYNVPRYFVEHLLGERALGIYATLAYFVYAGLTMVSAVNDSAVPRLANYHARGDSTAFLQILRKLLATGAVIGALGIGVTLLGGRLLLQLLYGAEYAAAAVVFVWIMVGALVAYIAETLGCALLAARLFRAQLMLLTCVALVMVAACAIFVPQNGLMGAAIAVSCAATVNALGAASLLFLEFARKARRAHPSPALLGGDKVVSQRTR